MNYTENYQLSQWVESDRVLMEDFNRDNAKIDAVLAELAAGKLGRCEPIDLPLKEKTDYDLIYDLSGVDWSQWEYVLIIFDITASYVSDEGHIRGTLNSEDGPANSHCTNQGSHFIYSSIGSFLLTLLPLHDPNRQVMGVCSGISGLGVCTHTFAELISICINYDQSGRRMPSAGAVALGIR